MIKSRRLYAALLVLFFGVAVSVLSYSGQVSGQEMSASADFDMTDSAAGVSGAFSENLAEENKAEIQQVIQLLLAKGQLFEEQVYTFLQGPRAYTEGVPYSGEWCYAYVRGNSFGGFGCGLCCMANIYSTLTEYECSPLDMYEYATDVSGYYPTKKSGAIGWGDMKTVLLNCGFDCDVYYKPDTYEAFQQQMGQAQSAIVLVSSYEDDTYWKNTSGHYVNIWLYDEETDQVFLAEPGSPENNRTWIPLKYVYDALKTSSKFQYLLVTDYNEENNQWKWDGIDDLWNAPD